MFRVREDAPVLDVAAVVQDEDTPVLEGRQGEPQGRPAEKGPELVLELLEPLGGDDRLLVDQIPLDRGEHLLVRHVRRPHDDEPGELERVRQEPLPEKLVGGGAPEELRARRLVEERDGAKRPHLEEPRVELDAEMPLEPGVRIARGEDERVVHVERHAVVGAQDGVVGVEEPPVGGALGVQVQPPLERPVRVEQEAPEARRRVDRAQLEGNRGGRVVLLPGRRREDARHQDLDQLAVALEHRGVVDRSPELGRPLEPPADRPGDVARDARLGGRALPRGDQRGEAQLAPERERRGRKLEPEARLGSGGSKPVHETSAAPPAGTTAAPIWPGAPRRRGNPTLLRLSRPATRPGETGRVRQRPRSRKMGAIRLSAGA